MLELLNAETYVGTYDKYYCCDDEHDKGLAHD